MAKGADFPLELVDTSHLTDADWTAIGKLKAAWTTGGEKAFWQAVKELDDTRWVNVWAAFDPDWAGETLRDRMAEIGMTEEDLRELLRKLESPAGKQ